MMQVHKETIDAIPNALSSRCDPEIEIYGMKGIPVEDMMRHQREAHAKTVSFIEYWDVKKAARPVCSLCGLFWESERADFH